MLSISIHFLSRRGGVRYLSMFLFFIVISSFTAYPARTVSNPLFLEITQVAVPAVMFGLTAWSANKFGNFNRPQNKIFYRSSGGCAVIRGVLRSVRLWAPVSDCAKGYIASTEYTLMSFQSEALSSLRYLNPYENWFNKIGQGTTDWITSSAFPHIGAKVEGLLIQYPVNNNQSNWKPIKETLVYTAFELTNFIPSFVGSKVAQGFRANILNNAMSTSVRNAINPDAPIGDINNLGDSLSIIADIEIGSQITVSGLTDQGESLSDFGYHHSNMFGQYAESALSVAFVGLIELGKDAVMLSNSTLTLNLTITKDPVIAAGIGGFLGPTLYSVGAKYNKFPEVSANLLQRCSSFIGTFFSQAYLFCN
ncbi:MAG: hypothetical protein ACI8VC_002822 [Candidatus Endobugula sp.]|jgi:hypothetical protein